MLSKSVGGFASRPSYSINPYTVNYSTSIPLFYSLGIQPRISYVFI